MNRNRIFRFTFLGVIGFVLFFNLWGRSLENHDYLRYAEVTKEMIYSGDWIVPRFNGEIFINKPPLLFWMIALSSSFYGAITPLTARLPSALFAWIGGLIVYLWGWKIWGEARDGLISSGVMVSSFLYFWQGRIARTDMVFSIFVLLSLFFFYLGYKQERRYLYTILSFFSAGMAGLTKGPVGFLFPILIILLFLLRRRELRFIVRKDFLLGYLVIIFLWSLWILPFLHRVGLNTALEVWNEAKILSRSDPFYIYGYRIWIDFAPWSLFLPPLIFYYWKKEKNRDEEFLIIWFLGLFLALTLFPCRSSKYLLPAVPSLALLMGGFWKGRSSILFLVVFAVAMISWHEYEYTRVWKNESKTTGPLLSRELKIYQEKDILGYRMDVDVLGKINFYGDTIIPAVKNTKDLKGKMNSKEEVLFITTEMGYQDLIKEGFQVVWYKKIYYRKGDVVLISVSTTRGEGSRKRD